LQRFSSLASREAVWRRASAAARRIFAAHNGAAEWMRAPSMEGAPKISPPEGRP